MLVTHYGNFDGNSWESLCQQVFKKKYLADGYLHVPDTSGDYGIEGYTAATGYAFQCYCPEENYATELLYMYQRNKMTKDLKKLKTNEAGLSGLLGETKICRWHFVTPKVANKDLIAHAKKKEKEVRAWGLTIIDPTFTVLIHDVEYYLTEIQEVNSSLGKALNFGGIPAGLPVLGQEAEVYEKNVLRKSEVRLQSKKGSVAYNSLLSELNQRTLSGFLEHDGHFRRMSQQFPAVHTRLMRLVNEYENEVFEKRATFTGDPNNLTDEIRHALRERIVHELSPEVGVTEAAKVARLMVARWLAVCELDYD